MLTRVCFLLGLSEQYEYNSFKDYNSLNDYIRGHDLVLPWQFSTRNIKEEEEYRGAIDRYLRGNADMSLLSSNEV